LTIEDAGVYECLAINDNGTAVSEKIKFEAAFIQLFEDEAVEIVRVELGEPYSRNCSPPTSNPHARVYWILMGVETGSFATINSSHISTNDQVGFREYGEKHRELSFMVRDSFFLIYDGEFFARLFKG
jgi:hypothetical protein